MHCPICGLWYAKDEQGFIFCLADNWKGNEAVRLVDAPSTVADPVPETDPVVIDDRPKKKGK